MKVCIGAIIEQRNPIPSQIALSISLAETMPLRTPARLIRISDALKRHLIAALEAENVARFIRGRDL